MNTDILFSEDSMDTIWWEQITKASHFIQTVTSSILNHNSIVIDLPVNTPWKDTLYDSIEGILRQGNPEYKLTFRDCPTQEAGQFLLEEFCKKEKRNSYRYGMSYAKFLAQSEDIVLNSRYVWIKGVSGDRLKEWLDFIAEYNKNLRKGALSAVFILETQEEISKAKKIKGVKYISFDDSINYYDKFAFCALASTGIDIKPGIRPYVAELVSSVCIDDIELCALCLEHWNDFVRQPYDTLTQIIASRAHSNGTSFSTGYSPETVETRIWEAQIKLLFPVVERYRTSFVKKYLQYVEKALPIETAYGELIDDPLDIELGALFHLAKEKMIPLTSKEICQLDTFRKIRNYLAHLKTLDFEQVEWLLSQKV